MYRLRSLDNAARVYYPVQRILGPDTEGVFYVGCSEEVRRRIVDLRKVVCTAEKESRYRNPGEHHVGHYYQGEAPPS